MKDFPDPLTLLLWLRQARLRLLGYRRRVHRLDGAAFGSYFRAGDAGRIPIVFLHGLGLFPEWWAPLLKRLPRPRTAAVPEFLGFGRSPGRTLDPGAFTLSLYRRQVRLLRETHGWDRMILCGVSLGGWVAADYALHHPGETAGLILYGPAGLDPDVTEEDLRELQRRFDCRTPEEFARLMNDYVFLKPRVIPRWAGRIAVRRSLRGGSKHLLHNLEPEDWIGARAEAIRAPTAFLWGREDRVFPIATGEKLAGAMQRARLYPLEDTAHSYLFERPGPSCRAFFEALDFVEGEGAGRAPSAPF